MAEHTRLDDSLESFMDGISEVAQTHFADDEVSMPVLHFIKDGAMGVLVLEPKPGLDSAHMARLVVGYYDPPVACVLAEGWATNLALPGYLNDALAGKIPWSEVSERVHKRLAAVLPRNPALAQALKRGDLAALQNKHFKDLIYGWHDEHMGPIVREGKSSKNLPAHLRRKILTLFGEDRQGNSKALLWRIERRDGRRHFVPEPLEVVNQIATAWTPLYIAQEMAAREGVPTALIRPRVRALCRDELRPYQVVEGMMFTDAGLFFSAPPPPTPFKQ